MSPAPRIDWDCGDIIIGDECRHLAPKELAILTKLVQRPGKPVSTEQMIWSLWGSDINGGPTGAENTLRQYIWRLRRKLPWTITIRRGYGYIIEDYDQSANAPAV